MMSKKEKQKTGRKLLKINPEEVEKLAALHCTNTEIAAFVGCDETTIRRRFADIIKKGKENGKIRLRQLQWNSAEAGNVTMQIFLGKQLLEQTDNYETKHSGEIGMRTLPQLMSELTNGKK